ncbi:SICA antigen [Plasmodium coatneyi]|uniref:SICA antigen n=1 Tax=Plasmodium coatneyi TaxID=208452 RepID=A0A1B1DVJ3_9APIC|nr:SICA antigen [Plasmodium coatneyi]ANQ06659.1 SICA antigen [Plasmodium coatneyi]
MAPQKKTKFEQQQTHPPKEAAEEEEHSPGSGAPRTRRARRAADGTRSKARKGIQFDGEFVITLGQGDMKTERVPSSGQGTKGDYVLLEYGGQGPPTISWDNSNKGPTTTKVPQVEVKTAVAVNKNKRTARYKCPNGTNDDVFVDVEEEYDDDENEKERSITEWFNLFSEDVRQEDDKKYKELNILLPLCGGLEEHLGDDMGKYEKFCEIMMKNIMFVTNPKNQYKNKEGKEKTPCKRTVNNIPICDLLKAWTYFMHLFCAPKGVIDYTFEKVKKVREEFKGALNKDQEYAECAYDGAPNIPDDNAGVLPHDVQQLLLTNMLYYKIMKESTKQKWCTDGAKWQDLINTLEDSARLRVDKDKPDQIISADDESNSVHKIVKQVEERLKEEKEEEKEQMSEVLQPAKEEKPVVVPQPEVSTPQLPPKPPQAPASPVLPARPPPPPPRRPSTPRQALPSSEDCTNKKTLCQRANCVAHNWFNDRTTNDGDGRQYWCNFWGGNDVGRVLRELSKAMTNGNGTDAGLCENIQDRNSTTPSEANKKACEYITKGLQHIYSIKEEEKQKYGNQKKNNRIFDQVIGCLFLNAYANKLRNLEKCPIEEKIIEQAFNEGNTQKETWCLDKGNGDCPVCEREQNYGECKLNTDSKLWYSGGCDKDKDNIKNKLDNMLRAEGKITQTLTDINNLCTDTTKPEAKDAKPERKESKEEIKPKVNDPSDTPAADDNQQPALRGGGSPSHDTPSVLPLTHKKENPVLPYLPLAPAVLGISVMSYLLWKVKNK